ncbi:hypothetical protein PHMEG_00025795 [Phytophthora megakarya]|uniref:Uncharacterized protein n=1 Tax=Phytophthora megakarya TaxID=4795 RepID=A0A225VC06_9STRA|nr:hypothetical protein PHMEG_00025795 [Phytophthora megakarya]
MILIRVLKKFWGAQLLMAPKLRALESITGDIIVKWLSTVPLRSPVDLRVLSTKEVMRYFTSIEQRGVTGKSTFGYVRSAIVYLFTQTDTLRPHDFGSLMKRFKGMHHSVARAAHNSNEREGGFHFFNVSISDSIHAQIYEKGFIRTPFSSRVLESHVPCQKC